MDDTRPAPLRVLVPTDGSTASDEAIRYAETLVTPGGALTLLTVVPPISAGLAMAGLTMADLASIERDARRQITADLRDRTDESASRLPDATVTTAIERGDPADVITRTACDLGCDLIVMRTHGRDMLGRMAFGSVADRVSRTATVPVLLVHHSAPGTQPFAGFRRILTLLDASALSAQSIPVVVRLAALLGLPVTLQSFVDEGAAYDPLLGFVPLAGTRVYAEMMAAAHEEIATAQAVATDMLSCAGVEVERVVSERPVLSGALDAIRPDDLVVLTSHGRSGLRRWVVGSVAEKIVRSAPAPVLLVRLPIPHVATTERSAI